MNLLLISNSTNPGQPYLGWPKEFIEAFVRKNKIATALFVPYAGVALDPNDLQQSYNNYLTRVAAVFEELNVKLTSIHTAENPIDAVKNAECIIVGGGNTFHLVHELHRNKVMDAIREKALAGTPFMGWSAGSNIACPTLRTTNDMPIIEPESFNCLNLIPFQINPHYLDPEAHPKGFGGETRDDRLREFMTINKKVTVVGLREATLLEVKGDKMELKGLHPMRIFKHGQEPKEVFQGDVSFLLHHEA